MPLAIPEPERHGGEAPDGSGGGPPEQRRIVEREPRPRRPHRELRPLGEQVPELALEETAYRVLRVVEERGVEKFRR